VIAFDQETCGDFETAIAKEWLETNGLGGFASSSILSCNTRRYHGLLVAASHPPLGRRVLVNGLEEWIEYEGNRTPLSCHQYPGVVYPQGNQHLIGFRLDPWPIWTYRVGPILLEKSLTLIHGQNTVIVTYRLKKDIQGLHLVIRPLLSGRDFHSLQKQNTTLHAEADVREGRLLFSPYDGIPDIALHHNAEAYNPNFEWFRDMQYVREKERGLDAQEDLWSPGELRYPLSGGQEAIFIATTEGDGYFDAGYLLNQERQRRRSLLSGWDATDDVTHHLVFAADQFLVERTNEQGEKGKTLIAGYPWFEDWGRDTFISMPGLLLSTGRFEEARQILTAYAHYVDHGMIPNRFPDATGYPEYNTVDASLWYVVAVFHYLRYTKDFAFVREKLWSTLQEIVLHYQNGTRYQIHMDLDGLIYAGQAGVQLTWMDAAVNDWAVTPRTGKPVEIQALWYNVLRIMDQIAQTLGEKDAARGWLGLAEKVWGSINRQFWNESTGCLYDVINGEEKDASIRPNQLFTISLPFECLTPDRAAQVVAVVEEKLLTPFGLRTLDPQDPRYIGRYQGDPRSRDTAYHQGTVWPWLMGPFLTAYQKVHGKTPKIQSQIRAHLALLLTHLWEAGLGTISEIFDGDMPHEARGCIAQAWSVGELLRVLREELGPTQSSTAATPVKKYTLPSSPTTPAKT
jgi:predicted glycogen debranching enzyme